MKKKYLTTVLMMCLVMFTAGCFGKTYLSEKLFWYAHKAGQEKIWKDPAKAAPEDFAAVIKGYQRVVTKTPGTMLAGRSQFLIAQLYVMQKEFDQAREAFLKVMQNYFSVTALASEAQFSIGFCYEAEGNWEAAEKEYKQVYVNFPLAVKGLQAPLYIASHYTRLGQHVDAEAAYERAISHYKELIRNSPLPEQILLVQAFLANTYAAQNDWKNAASALQEMVSQHPDFPNAPISLFNAAMIYKTKLNEPDHAHKIFEAFLEQYPEHALAAQVKTEINKLQNE